MALPENVGDREYQKFIEDEDGNVALRIGPNAIKSEEGYELEIDSLGRARTYDLQVLSQLKDINENLEKMIFQLSIITGADLDE